jgi:hypothetical protein
VFLVLRWMTLEKVPRAGAVRRWLYLSAKVLGVDPARRCLILSLQWVVVPFLGDVKHPGLNICGGVDCPGTYSPGTASPQAWLLGARACPKSGFEIGP